MPSGGLKLITLCAYLTDVTCPWRPEDHTSSKMVKALKGDDINGWFEYRVAGKNRRFDRSNVNEFVQRIPIALARMITRHIDSPATLVPIPNSHVIDAAAEGFHTLELAKAVAARTEGLLTAVPALVFNEPQVKSREGGPRSSTHFENAYTLVTKVRGPIVLLDDVCTGGGHLIGAYRKLASPVRSVILACAFGRSTKVQVANPVAPREEILDVTQ